MNVRNISEKVQNKEKLNVIQNMMLELFPQKKTKTKYDRNQKQKMKKRYDRIANVRVSEGAVSSGVTRYT